MSNSNIDINKVYLTNTILSVESHNRREQESDCWRQHKMLRKATSEDKNSYNDIRPILKVRRNSNVNADNDERDVWAAKKAQRMTSSKLLEDNNKVPASSAATPVINDIKNDKNERKAKKKEKKEKRERKKEKLEKADRKKMKKEKMGS